MKPAPRVACWTLTARDPAYPESWKLDWTGTLTEYARANPDYWPGMRHGKSCLQRYGRTYFGGGAAPLEALTVIPRHPAETFQRKP